MLMSLMLALTPMLALDALNTAAYADVDNIDADAKMPNVACHLASALLCC